jgi:CheY-like chemotaxis protein
VEGLDKGKVQGPCFASTRHVSAGLGTEPPVRQLPAAGNRLAHTRLSEAIPFRALPGELSVRAFERSSAVTTQDPHKLRVLIADESPAMRRQLGNFVMDAPELSLVGMADSATNTLNLFFQFRPDVVLVSICLPDRNGFDVLQSLKLAEPNCAVILMTKHPNPSVEPTSYLLGAHAVFAKSNSLAGLQEVLLSLLKEKVGGGI